MITFICCKFINRTERVLRLGGDIDTTNEVMKIQSFPQSPVFLANFCSVMKHNYSCQKYGILIP